MRVIAGAGWSPTPLESTTSSTGSIRLGILHLQDHSSPTASSRIPNSLAQLRHSQESSILKVDGVQGRARSCSRAEAKGRFFPSAGEEEVSLPGRQERPCARHPCSSGGTPCAVFQRCWGGC